MPDGPDAQRVAELGRSERRHPQHHGRWYWLVVSLAPVPAVVALAMTARHGWAPVEDPVARYLIAVSLALTVCPIIGAGMSRLGQPRIVGEVIGGIILGPSLFGWLWPQGHAWLFTPRVVSAIGMTAQLGLALFMFLLGCELRTDVVAQHRRAVALVVVGGAGLPFVCGVGLAAALGHPLAGNAAEAVCILFLGLALAITAVPVLARMLVDLGLDRSEVGTVSLAAAAVGDGIAWLGLALILAVTTEATSDNQLVIACLKATALLLVTLLWVRPLLAMLVDRIGPGRYTVLTSVLVGTALGYAAVSQLIGFMSRSARFCSGWSCPATVH